MDDKQQIKFLEKSLDQANRELDELRKRNKALMEEHIKLLKLVYG